MTNLDIETAVEAARRTGGPFVFLPGDSSPELVDALTAFAAESGREILRMPGESEAAKLAREAAARDVPTAAQGDNASFLANLDNIASGKARVE